ncbi:capsular polysaccharide synthesis protein [Fibrobacter sp. UWEL]|uniref:capsular polysaccharide synthesis protein n=1 Tax=Fibrobacter sp. UWEL TaxID=1896209 RepID=UPI0009113E59|nr:capsular polysaccharide synthesis protein [Fibrobacter sp. UWEL]SHK64790.1 Capsular polysaccharide synthesis protein [Fibrobacter sp. UWEL]
MKKMIALIKKMGGLQLVVQLCKSHVFFFSVFVTLLLGFEKRALEISRLAIANRRLQKLRKRYSAFMNQKKGEIVWGPVRKTSKKVWVLWLQGMDNAPELVKKCHASLLMNLKDREIVILSESNYKDYVQFPEYVQRKIDSGIISRTHFSDLLRLELLEKYGGTWIDATVFCSDSDVPNYVMDSELFVYQCIKPVSDGVCYSISSWLMTSCAGHPIIVLTKELLYEYWKKNDSMIDYFLLHYFFKLSTEVFPAEWNRVVPVCNAAPHMLLLRLFELFNSDVWSAIKAQSCFHKLSYKFEKETFSLPNTYYSVVVDGLQ